MKTPRELEKVCCLTLSSPCFILLTSSIEISTDSCVYEGVSSIQNKIVVCVDPDETTHKCVISSGFTLSEKVYIVWSREFKKK